MVISTLSINIYHFKDGRMGCVSRERNVMGVERVSIGAVTLFLFWKKRKPVLKEKSICLANDDIIQIFTRKAKKGLF